ncbi:MAG: type VI secretion system tube protein Hcp [Planctomycetes bacterium]|nr:type VI secretion system tube protein Hcp [Planctomycetota bacterium]
MAFDAFLKIKEIPGESNDKAHPGEIEVESFSWGLSQGGSSASGTGHGSGKAVLQDISFVIKASKASPNLMQFCANGQHIPEATFVVRKAGGTQLEYLKYKFTDIIVSSYQTGGSSRGNDDVPMESFSLNFTQIMVDYQEQGQDGKAKGGPIHGGWNVKTNVKA